MSAKSPFHDFHNTFSLVERVSIPQREVRKISAYYQDISCGRSFIAGSEVAAPRLKKTSWAELGVG